MRCPACEERMLRPVLHGLVVDPEMQDEADRGEVVLGGCMVGEDSPAWECPVCGRRLKDSDQG